MHFPPLCKDIITISFDFSRVPRFFNAAPVPNFLRSIYQILLLNHKLLLIKSGMFCFCFFVFLISTYQVQKKLEEMTPFPSLQHSPAIFPFLAFTMEKTGRKWPYIFCLVGCCLQKICLCSYRFCNFPHFLSFCNV